MREIPSSPESSDRTVLDVNISPMDTETDGNTAGVASLRRPRSHSYYSPEDAKHYGETPEKVDILIRPRSRSFYSYETSENYHESSFKNPISPQDVSLLLSGGSRQGKSVDAVMVKLHSKKTKSSSGKISSAKEMSGSRGSLKGEPMMTISESDNWEISSCSGMKYGQFVDWEKIDPESAVRYQKILKSNFQELKDMGRSGYWSMPHTLRAKAYYHIIRSLNGNSRCVTPDRDCYQGLVGQLFGEHKISTHPFPEYMENGFIPRHCLNKAGLNSVKKILLCIGQCFPEMNYCPILPALASLLLHFSADEAECFHSTCRLITYNDPNKRYIDQTFITYRASCLTFGDLANKFCHGVRKLIAASNQNLFEFYSDWTMWIFADLPFTYAIRVLDVYLLEGYKVLYRVALALLSLYTVSVASRVARVDDFRQDMKSFVESVSRHITIEKLIERAFRILLPTRQELNTLFNANKDALVQKGIDKHQKTRSYSVDLENISSSVVTGTEMRIIWAWIPERFALFNPTLLFSTREHGHSLASLYSHVEGYEPTVLLIKTVDEGVCGAFLSSDWIMRQKPVGEDPTFFGTGECFVFTLRPGMELYQRPILNLPDAWDRAPSPPDAQTATSPGSDDVATPATLTCPAGTPQDPNFLTIPFAVPSGGSTSQKRIKAQRPVSVSMFMAGDDNRLVVGGGGGQALCIGADLMSGETERCDTFNSSPLCKRHFRIQSLEVWGIQNCITVSPVSVETGPNTT